MKAIPYKFLFCTEQFFWSFFSMIHWIQLKNTSLRRPQWNGFLLTICWFIAKLDHPLYLTRDNETRHYMQFSLKSSHCRFIQGLRAESARAVTGRRRSHTGEGEDFLSRQPDFFTETAVTPERKVEKSIPRWEMNGLSEGYKQAVDQNWGRLAKIWFLGQKPRFWAQKTF